MLSIQSWPRESRNSIAALWLTILVVLGAAWIAIPSLVDREERAGLESARRNGRALAHVFAEQTTRTFQAIDQMLVEVVADMADGTPHPLRETVDRFVTIRSLLIQVATANARGDLIASNIGGSPGQINIADREHFTVHRDRRVQGLFISKPVKGRLSGQWSIQLSRGIWAADGTFDGIIVASVDPFGLAKFYDTLDTGRGGVVTLVGRDGHIRARSALTEDALSRPVPNSPVFEHLKSSPIGYFSSPSLIDGSVRLISYHALQDYPMVAIIGFNLAELTASDRQRWQAYYIVGALVSLGFVLAGMTITRSVLAAASAANSLQIQEARLRAVLDTVVDGIITTDQQGVIESLNAAATRMFDCTAHDAVGQSFKMLLGEPDRGLHDEYLAEYRRTGSANIIGALREVTGLRKDGTTFPMDLAIGETLVGGRRILTAVIRDITERKQAEIAKDEFISTVSHELRTPLTSIKGSLGLVRGGVAGELPKALMQMLDIAYNNCDRLVRLINDILDIEKISAGKMEFRMMPVDLHALLTQAIEANRGYGKERDVSLALKTDLSHAMVVGDTDRLMQVLANLMSNAVKFSPRNGEVEVGLARRGAGFRISIADRGPGIPEAFRSKIFQRFSQADSSDKRQVAGTGLGLSITKAIVERHDGTVSYDTEIGKGTTFKVDLPECREADSGARALQPDHAQGRRILICEDDPDVAKLIELMLEQDGLVVDIALSAADAKRRLAQHRYDAMTLDIGLPDQDGRSLIRELRQSAHTMNLPIVVVSALKSELSAEVETYGVQVVDWLEKPIDHGRLLASLHRAISSSSSSKPRILHVEDDADVANVIESIVGDLATVISVPTIAEARQRLSTESFDLAILDLLLPDGSGESLLSQAGAIGKAIPVIVFSVKDVPTDLMVRINSALVKSRASNDQLRNAILSALGAPSPRLRATPEMAAPPAASLS